MILCKIFITLQAFLMRNFLRSGYLSSSSSTIFYTRNFLFNKKKTDFRKLSQNFILKKAKNQVYICSAMELSHLKSNLKT